MPLVRSLKTYWPKSLGAWFTKGFSGKWCRRQKGNDGRACRFADATACLLEGLNRCLCHDPLRMYDHRNFAKKSLAWVGK
jgi:hypothetical protein